MKRSITVQVSVIFIGLITAVLATNLLVNTFFLERFYILKLQKTLVSAYHQLDDHIEEGSIDTEYFDNTLSNVVKENNLRLIVLTQNYETIVRTREDRYDVSVARLNGYQTGFDREYEVIRVTDTYTIQKKQDQKLNMDFLEMWGTLTCGHYFLMRIPLESVRASAKVSNEFILYISIIAVIVSIILTMWLSGRFTRPIKELTVLSQRMADLDFDAKYTSGGEDEIGQLGEHFNKMSETLEKTISQLKSANNELQRDIERKNKIDEMRKEFLSNVSHELKTPLALIQGYAEGLKECINDDADSRDFYCDVIIDEAGKMNTMVKKLLTLNQLEFGNDTVEMDRFDLAALISGKIQSTRILAQQKEAVLSYEGPSEMQVWGDEFKIEEVLTNYLSNALNHVDGERRILIRAHVENGKARVSVYNTGKPIPEEDIDKIWDKFYKVDKARTREYGGSGVGLSIVRAIMESMHQGYGVKNCGDGVEFWFELEYAG